MERLFDLDFQLLHDTALLAVAVFVLFLVMSYLLLNPIRKLLEDRQNKIQGDISSARKEKEKAIAMKTEYEAKLQKIDKEAELILSEARQKALSNEARIIDEAKQEASLIVKHAKEEALLEKNRVIDDMKQEMITIASMMAAKVIQSSIDTTIQNSLVEETLKEIGDSTWRS